jgi:hypothetical protein
MHEVSESLGRLTICELTPLSVFELPAEKARDHWAPGRVDCAPEAVERPPPSLRLVDNHQVARRLDSLPLEIQADAFLGLFEVEIETPSSRASVVLPL